MLKITEHFKAFVAVLALILLSTAVFSLFMGRFSFDFSALAASVSMEPGTPGWVLLHLRLPRILAAIITGIALASAGGTYQAIFRNPLVSSDILGVSAGAGFGAALAIYFDATVWQIEIAAFLGGLLTVGLALLVGKLIGHSRSSVFVLVLAGIVIGSLASAGISLIKVLADPFNKLQTINFWLLGSLSAAGEKECYITAAIVFICFFLLVMISWWLDLLSCGDEEARALGAETRLLKLLFVILATMMTGSVVALVGTIGWVGLLIPHAARALVGASHRRLIPTAALIGALFMLLVDTLARSLTPVELPIGVVTAFIGSPLFLIILLKSGKIWR